jgi:uncharacterized membrane protein
MTARTRAALVVSLVTLAAAEPASGSILEGRLNSGSILEGRFEMNVRVVHAVHLKDRRAGSHLIRALHVRRICQQGLCRYRFALEDGSGRFTRHPLQALSATRFRGREVLHDQCAGGRRLTSRAVLDLHAAATAVRGGRVLVSRLTGTFGSRSTGCAAGGYEAWTFTARRTDLPAPLPPPTAGFDATPRRPTITKLRNTVVFADASHGQIVRYAWEFGDPASGQAKVSTERSPRHTYASAGIYRVTLHVTDQRGLTDTAERVIEIGP